MISSRYSSVFTSDGYWIYDIPSNSNPHRKTTRKDTKNSEKSHKNEQNREKIKIFYILWQKNLHNKKNSHNFAKILEKK